MVVGEVLIYDVALTDDRLASIGSYLEQRYGLDTPYPDSSSITKPDEIAGLFSWFKADAKPGIKEGEAVSLEPPLTNIQRSEISGEFSGVEVKAQLKDLLNSYALGVVGEKNVRVGADLGDNTQAWRDLGRGLPPADSDDFGSSVAVDFTLAPDATKTIPYVLTWYAPVWRSNYGNPYENMYGTRFASARDVARHLVQNRKDLLRRIIQWQEAIFGENRLPGWLHDSLINVLAVLAQESFLVKSPDPTHWWGEDGFFSVCESLQSCPQQACIANDMTGEWAVNLLFPNLGLRKLEAFKHYQNPDTGETPSTLGAGTDPDKHWFGQQLAIDGQVYIQAVDRYRLASGEDSILTEWYPSVKAELQFMFKQDTDGDGLIDVHGRGHYLDAWPMEGAAVHVSTLWLSTLKIVQRMAQLQGDEAFANECQQWHDKGAISLNEKLWNDSVGSYLLYHDTATGDSWDTVVCDQLIGDIFAYLHGVSRIAPPERVDRILASLERLNLAATPHGIRIACRPDGSEDASCSYSSSIVPSYSTLAVATAMLRSSNPHFQQLGPEIVRRTWHNMVMHQNMAWDMPCMLHVDGTRSWGLEYYHNTMLWVLPLAILGEDIQSSTRPGGFVNLVRKGSAE